MADASRRRYVGDNRRTRLSDTFPILAMFHGDGTYMEIYPWGAIFVGVWKPTGERTAEGTLLGYGIV